MKKSILVGLAGLLLLASPRAFALPPREAVERLLGGYESQPTAADFRRLGDGVEHVLAAIALDPKTPPLRRNRALASLALVPSSEGRELLRAVIRDDRAAREGVALLDLRVAVRSLGAFGAEEEVDLVPLLAHPDADVRGNAALALSEAHVVAAVPSLRLRLGVEREGSVVRALSRALAALEGK